MKRMSYFVTTTDSRRRQTWLMLFDTDALPVKTAAPRWQVVKGEFGETEVMAYDLDASRLSPGTREEFARYIARKTGQRLEETRDRVDGWPIKSVGLSVIEGAGVV